MAVVLVIFLVIYTALTLLPLCYLDSPYRTPLSGILWRLGNSFGDFLTRVHELIRRNETLTSAILEKSVQRSAERDVRDQKALVAVAKSLTDDDELLPFIEAIPDALFSPNNWHHVRQENVKFFIPLLISADSDVNIFSRISQFMSKRYSLASQFRTRSSSACPRAIWSLAWASMDEFAQRSRLRDPNHISHYRRSVQDTILLPNVWIFFPARDTSLPSFGKDMWSALAAMRLSWLCSIRSTVDLIADLLRTDHPSGFNVTPDHELSTRFSRAIKICEDIDINKQLLLVHNLLFTNYFPSSLKEFISILRTSTQVGVVKQIERIKPYISRLRGDEPWRPIQLSILHEYLILSQQSVELTGELPFEFGRICEAIYPSSEPPIELDDNHKLLVVPDTCGPLLALKRHVAENKLNGTTDMLMKQHLKLLVSTNQPRNHERFVECRQFIQWYIIKRGDIGQQPHPTQGDWWEDFGSADLHRIGECILDDMQYPQEDEEHLTTILTTAFVLLSSAHILRTERDMFPKIFVYLHGMPLDMALKRTEGYTFFKTLLDLVLSIRLAPTTHRKRLPQDTEHFIGAGLYQDYLHLPFPDLAESRDTLVVAILSRYIDLSYESKSPLHCRGALNTALNFQKWFKASVHERSQLLFAKSISKLMHTITSGVLGPGDLVLILCDVLLFFRDRWLPGLASSADEISWDWITSLPAATIISDTILHYREPKNVTVPDIYRQLKADGDAARGKLLTHCQQILPMPKSSHEG
ncbi:hypothetical protein VKT23_002617 [Stygiomarasmius scandens]|uniref:Uncharacterized protein n=1 Tax=Marasmiellus scandens TaxID=2682957 RepID=A0ABR1K2J1_9AGAR